MRILVLGAAGALDKTFPVTVTNGMVNAVEVAAAGSTGGTELTGLQQ